MISHQRPWGPTKKQNNHTRHKPENARPQRPPAQRPNRNLQQRHKTAKQGQTRGRRAQAGLGGAGQTPMPEPAKPRQQGGTRPTNAEGEMARGHRKATRAAETKRRGAAAGWEAGAAAATAEHVSRKAPQREAGAAGGAAVGCNAAR
jgi:hypothetical protein